MYMNKTRRITANIPLELLADALSATGEGITETLVQGLRLVKRSRAFDKAQKLKGKLELQIDIRESRERTYR